MLGTGWGSKMGCARSTKESEKPGNEEEESFESKDGYNLGAKP